MLDLSIIIPCYIKTEELYTLTESTSYSLSHSVLPPNERIIIDDNSPIYGGFLRSIGDTYILHSTNYGFIGSVNDGIRVARGKYLLITNNDVRVQPHFFKHALEIFEQNPDVISVHPRMCFYDEPFVNGDKTYITGRERWCQSSFFIMRGDPGYLFPEHFGGTGGAYEDWHFWSMIRRDGWKTAYTTKTCFQHKDSSTTQVVGEQSKNHERNRELFKAEFGDYPEEYYEKLYPEQMQMNWREEFMKI